MRMRGEERLPIALSNKIHIGLSKPKFTSARTGQFSPRGTGLSPAGTGLSLRTRKTSVREPVSPCAGPVSPAQTRSGPVSTAKDRLPRLLRGTVHWGPVSPIRDRSRELLMSRPGTDANLADPSTSNRRRTDRVSPIRPRLITCTFSSIEKSTSGNIHKRLTRG
uniref:Uncharacterized protein n=1 Tax=Ananas comosus var. bracteatus TaxID=296719 RepID=A0A6V7P4Q3_ANACO|nr:unnamed protein product [Ananas comosus var. bracteatus]